MITMAIRNIVKLGDDCLRKVCKPQEKFDLRLWLLLKDMADTMYKAEGVGLAGPQVGILRRVVVIDVGDGLVELINPVIVDHSENTVVNYEGCLSVPGINGDVERWEWVEVECYNEDYQLVRYKSGGLFGRCMQHELDHLDGKTYVDRMPPLARIQALKDYDEARARGAKPG